MNLNLKDKNVLVTGSSKGIGLEIAKKFLNEGCKVIFNSRNRFESKILDQDNACHIIADTSIEGSAKKLVEDSASAFGNLDILVCNVGSGSSVPPGEETIEAWEEAFKINFYSAVNVIQAAKSQLKLNKGVVICISSICGKEVIRGAPVTYSVAKAALNSYVNTMAVPLADDGIRINGIAPGNILFEGSTWEKKLKQNSNMVKNMLDENVPLKSFGNPSDIADLTIFLASSKAANVTGSVWVSDGGQTCSF